VILTSFRMKLRLIVHLRVMQILRLPLSVTTIIIIIIINKPSCLCDRSKLFQQKTQDIVRNIRQNNT